MFTGIITHQGRVLSMQGEGVKDLWVESALPLAELELGASIAHSGVCLTLVEKAAGRHRVQLVSETVARSTAKAWGPGTSLNLERSLRLGDELGGHLVFGHADAVGRIEALEEDGEGWRMRVSVPPELAPLVAEKGSIAVDGISLTVTAADRDGFSVAVIPHTFAHTTLKDRKAGDPVNLEADMLARYVARSLSFAMPSSPPLEPR